MENEDDIGVPQNDAPVSVNYGHSSVRIPLI